MKRQLRGENPFTSGYRLLMSVASRSKVPFPKPSSFCAEESIVNELFALFCDVYLAYVDSQYVATISKKAQRTHEEGEKKEGRRKHKTATSVLTVVEFKVERGYASSMLRFSMEQETPFNDQGQENWSEGGNLFGGDWDY